MDHFDGEDHDAHLPAIRTMFTRYSQCSIFTVCPCIVDSRRISPAGKTVAHTLRRGASRHAPASDRERLYCQTASESRTVRAGNPGRGGDACSFVLFCFRGFVLFCFRGVLHGGVVFCISGGPGALVLAHRFASMPHDPPHRKSPTIAQSPYTSLRRHMKT